MLYLVRPQVLGIPYHVIFGYPGGFYVILLASYYDILLAAGLVAFFMALAYPLRKRPGARRLVLAAFVGCALLSVWAGLAYVTTSKLLGGPLTYAWLYCSDFLQSSDSKASLRANVSWAWAAEALAWSAASLGTGVVLYYASRRLDPRGRFLRWAVPVAAVGLLVFFAQGPRRAKHNNLTYKVMANPLLAFPQSVYLSLATVPDLFAMKLPPGFEAFPAPGPAGDLPRRAPFHLRVRNVLVFVLESVPAEYAPGYQARYEAMPELARHLPNSLMVSDMYAQMPSTNNAVVTLLGSLYPQISYESISKEHPAIAVPSLSSELKKRGFRTGFFFAADTRFQNMNGFLAHRGFDVVADYQTIPCAKPAMEVNQEKDNFLNSSDESCLLNACTRWLPADSAQAPFFAMVWTAQTHYPYFPPPQPEKDYGVTEHYLNRYLNALHYSDVQLGKLLGELKRRGLAESTLVVVMGNHGEAFGRHVQYGHASNIYEENVHIPFFLINPLLFHGEKLQAVGGQVDVAPSIFDVLRLPAPAEWQGTSLFDPKRLNRAYFFSPYSDYSFGFRTPQYKVIFNAYASKTQVFDLQKDPRETTNLADQMPGFVRQSHQRLARWVQYQNGFLKRFTGPRPVAKAVVSRR